jgi:hypothetical protein
MAITISWILGALASIAIAILVEWLRKPRLDIVMENPALDRSYEDAPAKNARYLRVLVRNIQPSRYTRGLREMPPWSAKRT